MKRLKALWDLMRLEHGVMILVAILVGSLIANRGALPDTFKLIFSFLTALFLEASTFALNDYFDLEIDKKNKRDDRPLVREDIQPRTALILFSLLFPLGIISSFLVNLPCFLIALITALFAIAYDVKIKKIKPIGNFYIAYIMAVPFLFGAAAVSPNIPPIIWLLASIAFFAGVGREIMKDVMDIAGDRSQGVRSFPMYIGERNAYRVAAVFYIIAVMMSFIPFFLLKDTAYYGNTVYLALVGVTDILFLITAATLIVKRSPPTALFRKTTLVAIVFGLLAFLQGAFLQG
jgi:geranylgeranylglycerol-phosphate geranylgeranyltransferase